MKIGEWIAWTWIWLVFLSMAGLMIYWIIYDEFIRYTMAIIFVVVSTVLALAYTAEESSKRRP